MGWIMKSSYVDGLQKEILSPVFRYPAGDAIYASWNQCSTGTGRLASADPNMQTLPKVGMEWNEKSDDWLAIIIFYYYYYLNNDW